MTILLALPTILSTSALLMKWRDSTIDIDLKMVPERDALFRAPPELKERLGMNIELAAPDKGIAA